LHYDEQYSLDIIHPEKARVEHFLNNVDGYLQQIPFDTRALCGIDDIIAGFKFSVKGRSAFAPVIFAASYSHANKTEAVNLATQLIEWEVSRRFYRGNNF
jgi:hypothetical protein